ncbi:MAG: DsrE family protein [Methylobacteriaceae bacterium]|nr:DsrE family protein [Methylobacteriaceae bacterium]
MRRRTVFQALLGALGGLAGTRAAQAATPGPQRSAAKAVYHLADLDKVAFALGAIENHIAGVGGAQNATIALVVHGPALRAFRRDAPQADIVARAAGAARQGVALFACGNTMRSMKIESRDLAGGFEIDDRGGVVRLAELQAQGYAYIRP